MKTYLCRGPAGAMRRQGYAARRAYWQQDRKPYASLVSPLAESSLAAGTGPGFGLAAQAEPGAVRHGHGALQPDGSDVFRSGARARNRSS